MSGNDEIDNTAHLAVVASVLGQEDCLTTTRQLQEQGEARLKLMLPIGRKAQAFHVKRQAATCVRDSELRE